MRRRELGEARYVAWAQDQALDWIRANPGRFGELTVTRLRHFWVGPGPGEEARDWMGWVEWAVGLVTGALGLLALALWRGGPGSGWLVRGVLLLFPIVYAVTHVLPRYRFPIDGVVLLAGAAVLAEVLRRRAHPS